MIQRTLREKVLESVKHWPVTLITGARQVGKTTLCLDIADELGFEYVSLDDPYERSTAINDPSMFISTHPTPLVIDEVQYAPGLFDAIEHLVNERKKEGSNKGMYILTGSHAYGLMDGVSQSMSGRVNVMELPPLSVNEIDGVEEVPFKVDPNVLSKRSKAHILDQDNLYARMLRGSYPGLYDDDTMDATEFYRNYVSTYLDRDVSQMLNIRDKSKFIDFLRILASLTGEELVYETISKAVGVSANTIKAWISILEAGHVVYVLRPYYSTSMVKRMVKHPKIYFWDTGLACYLMGIHDVGSLKEGIYKGRLIETAIINEVRKSYINNGEEPEMWYYRDRNGTEVDLVIFKDGKVELIECKSGSEFGTEEAKVFRKVAIEPVSGKCIICNTPKMYFIEDGIIVVPIGAI